MRVLDITEPDKSLMLINPPLSHRQLPVQAVESVGP
jgi:hypothetical protein